jgi:hypothetical protein
MQVAFFALLPLLHILVVVVFVVGAVANMKRSPALSGVLALVAALSAMITSWFFLALLRSV